MVIMATAATANIRAIDILLVSLELDEFLASKVLNTADWRLFRDFFSIAAQRRILGLTGAKIAFQQPQPKPNIRQTPIKHSLPGRRYRGSQHCESPG
jgi:hypothetical protein